MSAPDDSPSNPVVPFTPAKLRRRHDGWTPKKQVAFIEALAQCGCVDEACQRVGMHRSSAYDLRARKNAEAFRAAWDAALDHAVQRLSDAAFGRAINGVSRPVFYKGELIGERTYFDERLTMFMLRYRDPARYGKWRDQMRVDVPPDGIAQHLHALTDRVEDDAACDAMGAPRLHFVPDPPQQVSEARPAPQRMAPLSRRT
jgi:hypothetical protein